MTFNGTVLLVDDEPHIRKYVSLLLRQVGQPKIIEAGNGEEALEAYAAHKPDLAFGAVNYLRKDTPKDEITQALKDTIAATFEQNP
jgi:two-component system chemotaxis response regulator CheY